MFEHTATMVQVAYTRKPKVNDTMSFKSAATHLRSILCVLNAKTTIWGHVWTCHAAQFVIPRGTLFPFLCHGQWKAAVVGFEQVLKYSIVAWAISRFGMCLVRRTRHVTKTKTKQFDSFLIGMVATQNGSQPHPTLQFRSMSPEGECTLHG